MSKKNSQNFVINITENHNLLYYNLPKELITQLQINEMDILEYDVRGEQFFCKKKGIVNDNKTDSHLFAGLQVERNVTKNNTILRTNLPKEVAQPLSIDRNDTLELVIEGKTIIGTKIKRNDIRRH